MHALVQHLSSTSLPALEVLLGTACRGAALWRLGTAGRLGLALGARLRLLGRGLLCRLTKLGLLRLLILDVIQRHAHDRLLELLRLARALLGGVVRVALLVHAAPGLGPAQPHGLDPLMEEGVSLGADEEAHLAVPGHKLLAASWVDTVLRVRAQVRLHDHRCESKMHEVEQDVKVDNRTHKSGLS